MTAPTAAEADAMSTAAFVLGAGAERLTRLNPALGAVVLSEDRTLNPVRQGRSLGRSVSDLRRSAPGLVLSARPTADRPP